MKQHSEEFSSRTRSMPAAEIVGGEHTRSLSTGGAGRSFPALQAMAAEIEHSPLMARQQKKAQGLINQPVQRLVEEEEPVQGKAASVQRQLSPEEDEEPLQGQWREGAALQRRPDEPRSNRTGMPDTLKQGVESLSGLSLDEVRVHYNSPRPAQVKALAYARGTDIHLAPGQEQHLPHEAWHVVQQAQGRVQPTGQLQDGIPVNDDQGLEQEADAMGNRASR